MISVDDSTRESAGKKTTDHPPNLRSPGSPSADKHTARLFGGQ
jgi:hypothetical protein